ncbi:MAG: hypothetical protein AB1679_12870 [Actinomycetota bacterium]|jgi:hypothetical protein
MVVVDPQTWVARHDPLTVVPLRDPVVEAVGHDPRSAYVESFWTPILGPSAVMAARHLSARLEDSPEGVTVSLAVLARQLGLGAGTGRNAPHIKSLARLTVFGLARTEGDVYALRLAFPPLARRHLRCLTPQLVEAHRLLTEGPPGTSDIAAVAHAARC